MHFRHACNGTPCGHAPTGWRHAGLLRGRRGQGRRRLAGCNGRHSAGHAADPTCWTKTCVVVRCSKLCIIMAPAAGSRRRIASECGPRRLPLPSPPCQPPHMPPRVPQPPTEAAVRAQHSQAHVPRPLHGQASGCRRRRRSSAVTVPCRAACRRLPRRHRAQARVIGACLSIPSDAHCHQAASWLCGSRVSSASAGAASDGQRVQQAKAAVIGDSSSSRQRRRIGRCS